MPIRWLQRKDRVSGTSLKFKVIIIILMLQECRILIQLLAFSDGTLDAVALPDIIDTNLRWYIPTSTFGRWFRTR